MRRWLIQRGVRPSHVIDDHAGFRTLDTMARAAQVYRIDKAVVCTQSFHLPRAVFLARRAGIDAEGLAVDGFSARVAASDAAREWLADVMAVVDSYLLRRQPRERGAPASLDMPPPGAAPGQATWISGSRTRDSTLGRSEGDAARNSSTKF